MEQVGFNSQAERKELPIKVEILSAEELKNLIWQGENLPQDKRFLDFEKDEGKFDYFDLGVLQDYDLSRYKFPVVKKDNLIVALAQLEASSHENEEDIDWISFVSVDPDYQNQKHASRLLEAIFQYAKKHKRILKVSSYYTIKGVKKLKPKINKLAEKYGVKIIDGEVRISKKK